ncbi:class F sortase [Amycolatopsis sp. NPDC004378]
MATATGTLLSTWHEPSDEEISPAVAGLETPSPQASLPATQPANLPTKVRTIRPVRLDVPQIGVEATVIPAGVDEKGAFFVPPSVNTVGWYRFGPGLDASAGSLVIGGHVDSAEAGPGAFFRLKELKSGSVLSLTGDDNVTRAYKVVATERIAKDKIDLRSYFATMGAPRVTLFTCGGSFDRTARSYRDNIVVTAVPTQVGES